MPGLPPRNIVYNKWVLLEQRNDENVAHSERARQENLRYTSEPGAAICRRFIHTKYDPTVVWG